MTHLDRVILSLDGSHACALLGDNLQVGEAEFEPIPNWPHASYSEERTAAFKAFRRLLTRLGRTRETTSYALGDGLAT